MRLSVIFVYLGFALEDEHPYLPDNHIVMEQHLWDSQPHTHTHTQPHTHTHTPALPDLAGQEPEELLAVIKGKTPRQPLISKDRTEAQRAFLFVNIIGRGLLLLVAEKEEKGIHYQLPGGRIDAEDFQAAGISPDTNITEAGMVVVGRIAAIREFYEETKFALDPDRVVYLVDVTTRVASGKKSGRGYMHGHLDIPRKLYFITEMTPEEFEERALKLSQEHIGYIIQESIKKAAKMVKDHSGGDGRIAIQALNDDHWVKLIRM